MSAASWAESASAPISISIVVVGFTALMWSASSRGETSRPRSSIVESSTSSLNASSGYELMRSRLYCDRSLSVPSGDEMLNSSEARAV
jgi:hypothetical protein